MYSKKYIIENIKEFGRHNHLYDGILGCVCYLAYLNVGERGWILYESGVPYDMPHRVHTSPIASVEYDRGGRVIVTTQNTKFIFTEKGLYAANKKKCD